jgi:deazaflavin-dependent oxidoreductase (nitroreductase family)
MAAGSFSEEDRFAASARDAFVKFWSSWHDAVYRVTGGTVLNRLLGMTVIQLTTIGRRTREPRSTMLTAPIVEDGLIVLVASNGGDERDPQWYQNILACPTVCVALDGTAHSMTARIATGSERLALWQRIRDAGPTYHLYQKRTSRQIPLVVLEETPDGRNGDQPPIET